MQKPARGDRAGHFLSDRGADPEAQDPRGAAVLGFRAHGRQVLPQDDPPDVVVPLVTVPGGVSGGAAAAVFACGG
jgi:hypothetical protein